ncbi:hypothetical protein F441_05282 [Phytophthora nicotianae CJ01A1]|uniref:DUF659 domain-containing protein n=2 Tax=Phytophthora nicotianae TaxID=4792 RepID=V9FJW2_PHYNI|nr:hypothetical protein F443_05276 [Phytophthora nicotianae P1569]ETP21085.1 hypothetical protein F441_05282 [Phytophthora nicotianae CJ01A1]
MGFYSTEIPFRVAEEPSFQAMFDYKLPSRHQLSGNLLDTVYSREKDRVISLLKEASDLAIVSDGWTNISGDSIVNFVLVNPRFSSVLSKSINTVAHMHTGEYIADTILTTIADVGHVR